MIQYIPNKILTNIWLDNMSNNNLAISKCLSIVLVSVIGKDLKGLVWKTW